MSKRIIKIKIALDELPSRKWLLLPLREKKRCFYFLKIKQEEERHLFVFDLFRRTKQRWK